MSKKIYAFWWEHENDTCLNFGDILTPVLIKKLSGRKFVRRVSCSKISIFLILKKIYGFFARKNSWKELKYTFLGWTARKIILACGSIIQWNEQKKSVIWGSGLIFRNVNPQKCEVRAVRGPFTRKELLMLGFDVPPIYGDPAILLPLVYAPRIEQKFDLALIPHYTHFRFASENLKNHPAQIIDLLNINPLEVVDQILACKMVLSSSLHGLIAAHTYGIPALWVNFGDISWYGDNIKFQDYFASVGIDCYEPIELSEEMLRDYKSLFEKYEHLALPTTDLDSIRKNLIECAPFPVLPEIKAKWKTN